MDRHSVNLSASKRQTPAQGGGLEMLLKRRTYLVLMPLPTFGSFSILRVM